MISIYTCLFLFGGLREVRTHCVCMFAHMHTFIRKFQAPTKKNDCELDKSLIQYFLYKILVAIFTCLTGVS